MCPIGANERDISFRRLSSLLPESEGWGKVMFSQDRCLSVHREGGERRGKAQARTGYPSSLASLPQSGKGTPPLPQPGQRYPSLPSPYSSSPWPGQGTPPSPFPPPPIWSKFKTLTSTAVLDLSLVTRWDVMITRLSLKKNSKDVDWALEWPWFLSSKNSLDVALSSFPWDSNDRGSSPFTHSIRPWSLCFLHGWNDREVSGR